MADPVKKEIASEGGHWYDAKTGEPRYTIVGANGQERSTTLRDARKLGLVPSVTTITKIMDKPLLGAWLQKQVLIAALLVTRLTDETDEAWHARIMDEASAKSKAARDKGAAVHGAIERYAQGQSIESDYAVHCASVEAEMLKSKLVLKEGKSEHSFAHVDGFGGKNDWHNPTVVVDFKTKDKIDDAKKLVWDEHVMQLAAYAYGLGIESPRCMNVFIGVTDNRVVVVEHDAVEIARGLRMFKLALDLWKEKNNVA